MRRLAKAPTPQVLVHEGSRLTTEYMQPRGPGQSEPTPWRHREIVDTLAAETASKCAYCEVIIADVAAPHVEHILPKSSRPELVVEWTNLTIACPNCNTYKGTYYSVEAPLLDPYVHEPGGHIDFAGPAITGKPGDDLGKRTVAKLRLMRPPLVIERAKRVQELADRIDRWSRVANADEKAIYEEEIRRSVDNDAEFTATLRAFAASKGFPVDPPPAECEVMH